MRRTEIAPIAAKHKTQRRMLLSLESLVERAGSAIQIRRTQQVTRNHNNGGSRRTALYFTRNETPSRVPQRREFLMVGDSDRLRKPQAVRSIMTETGTSVVTRCP